MSQCLLPDPATVEPASQKSGQLSILDPRISSSCKIPIIPRVESVFFHRPSPVRPNSIPRAVTEQFTSQWYAVQVGKEHGLSFTGDCPTSAATLSAAFWAKALDYSPSAKPAIRLSKSYHDPSSDGLEILSGVLLLTLMNPGILITARGLYNCLRIQKTMSGSAEHLTQAS